MIHLLVDPQKRTLTILQELRDTEVLDVKEIQRNDWLIDYLDEQLHNVGLTTISKHVEVNKFSLFRRSKPDLAFYQEDKASIKAGLVVQQEQISLHGAAVAFKINEISCSNYPQLFADVMRVANDIVSKTIEAGKIIESITVYGLLVSHNKWDAIPVKYSVDFTTNSNQLLMGDKGSFGELFALVIFVGLLGAQPSFKKQL